MLVASQPALASAKDDSSGAETVTAVDAPKDLTTEEEAQLRSFFDEYDVTVEDQNSLLESYESGDRWLSMTAGAEPVEVRIENKAGMRSTVSTYEDGSVAVAGTQAPTKSAPTGAGPLSVTGCSTSGSTRVVTYSNCLAKVDNGVVMMSFRFTWRLYVGSSASITSFDPDSRNHRCIGCIMSDHRVYRISSTNVRYSATIGLPPGEYLGWMGVRVSTSGASTYQGP
jgi:hypothetical protein